MYVAIMGYGVVGSGVAQVLRKNKESITKKCGGQDIQVKYILDLRDFPGDAEQGKFIKDFSIIEQDDSVGIVVETMGGLNPAYDYVSRCLKAGKSVVTSNKELVAEKGDVLLALAKENNANFFFEASVGGGIPIIRPISQCLAANEIDEIIGILNGTTNFILTMMIHNQMSFDDALKLAQDNGYAEKDPTADIEGHDACRKICILAALCFGKHVYPKDVFTQGITKITLEDVAYAKNWGGVIKLIARSKKVGDERIFALVSPAMIKNDSQLAGVNDVFNAILVRGDATGDVVFYGKGAGKLPTASAVVADVIDGVNHINKNRSFAWGASVENYVADYNDIETALYVRGTAEDVSDAYSKAEKAFGSLQRLTRDNKSANELAFVTPVATERELKTKLRTVGGFNVESIIRIVDC